MVFTTLSALGRHINKHHISFCNERREHTMENLVKIKNYLNSEPSADSVNVPAMFFVEDGAMLVDYFRTEITIGKYCKDGGYTYSERRV